MCQYSLVKVIPNRGQLPPVTTNSTVDAPCGTGPEQIGYWSFNAGPFLLDYWAGESNALDCAGTNIGTIYNNVTYTNGVSCECEGARGQTIALPINGPGSGLREGQNSKAQGGAP
jgi:hypothetical protein